MSDEINFKLPKLNLKPLRPSGVRYIVTKIEVERGYIWMEREENAANTTIGFPMEAKFPVLVPEDYTLGEAIEVCRDDGMYYMRGPWPGPKVPEPTSNELGEIAP
jgi:hypothetical protein